MEEILKDWRLVPDDVHKLLRSTKYHLGYCAQHLCDETYIDEWNRESMASELGFMASAIDSLLCEYGLPSDFDPRWVTEPETEAEEIERKLLKNF
jgi:hypothetical protein